MEHIIENESGLKQAGVRPPRQLSNGAKRHEPRQHSELSGSQTFLISVPENNEFSVIGILLALPRHL